MKNIQNYERKLNCLDNSPYFANSVVLACFNEEPKVLNEARQLSLTNVDLAEDKFFNERISFIRYFVVSSCAALEMDCDEIRFKLIDEEGADFISYTPVPDAFGSKHSGVMTINLEGLRHMSVYALAYELQTELNRAYFMNEKIDGQKIGRIFTMNGYNPNEFVRSNLYKAAYQANGLERNCNYYAHEEVKDIINATIRKYGKSDYLVAAKKEVDKINKQFIGDYDPTIMLATFAGVVVNGMESRVEKREEDKYFSRRLWDLTDKEYLDIERKINLFRTQEKSWAETPVDENDRVKKEFFKSWYGKHKVDMVRKMIAYSADELGISMRETKVEGFSYLVDKLTFVDYKKFPENKKSQVEYLVIIPEEYAKLSPKDLTNKIFTDLADVLQRKKSMENVVENLA